MKRFLIYSDSSSIYGAEQINHLLALAARRTGYHVVVAQPEAADRWVKERENLGIQHHWLPPEDIYDWHHPAPSLSDSRAADTCYAEHRPNLILFADSFPFSNLAAKKAAARQGIRYLVLVHCVQAGWAEQYSAFLASLATAYQSAGEVVAVSTDNLDLLRSTFGLAAPRGRVIYNGRPPIFFEPRCPLNREQVRRELGIGPEKILVLSIGRFELVKGYQYLLDALRTLRGSSCWNRLALVWVGSGTLERRMRDLSRLLGRNHVFICPEREDIVPMMDAADMLVHPAVFEGMPLVVLEAMAKGVVVIASAVSGIPEAIADTGMLLGDPANNPAFSNALATAICEMAEDPERRQTLADAARERARIYFSEDRMCKDYLHLIQKLIGCS